MLCTAKNILFEMIPKKKFELHLFKKLATSKFSKSEKNLIYISAFVDIETWC